MTDVGDPADEERRLEAAAVAGDPVAWDLVCRRVYPRLLGYVARRVPAGDVDDAVSETMTRAISGIGRFEGGPAGVDGWIFGIARRVTADYYRGLSRHGRQRAALDNAVVVAALAAEEPGDDLLLQEDQAAVRRAFSMLTVAEQEVLELRVIAGLSAEQVAAVMRKRPGSIRSAQSRALAHLRRLMVPPT